MFGPQRHQNLASVLPFPPAARVVDLGCGHGGTLMALLPRLDSDSHLAGLDIKQPKLPDAMAADVRVETVIADLNEPLPFGTASFDAAVSHNTIECLHNPDAFIAEVARVLAPGGHLLLGHADFDTLVFSSADLALTRLLVQHFSDAVPSFMEAANGTIGRQLVALARRSPLELVETFAWVGHHTTFEEGGPAHTAASCVAAEARRDTELEPLVEQWLAELQEQAEHGEFFYSINDYAVLLHKPSA